MSAIIRICYHDSLGLQKDYLTLQQALSKEYHIECCKYPEEDIYTKTKLQSNHKKVDINVFLEHIHCEYISSGRYNILIPNPEMFTNRDALFMQRIDIIIAKSQHGFAKFQEMYPGKWIVYSGFTSESRYDESVEKKLSCVLHIKGRSRNKNSQILVDTWQKHPDWPMLVVIHHGDLRRNGTLHFTLPYQATSNITVYQKYVTETEMNEIMNKCGIHFCASFSEGFGHSLNEARSCGAFILTTNGFPMNEVVKDDKGIIFIKPEEKCVVNSGIGYNLSEFAIENAMDELREKADSEISQQAKENKQNYVKDYEKFQKTILEIFKKIIK